jgi:hypothetical protein
MIELTLEITRIYLSALSPIVWQPDETTLERREVFSAYQAVVEGLDLVEATAARDVERTLGASGEGVPPLSRQSDYAPACTTRVDADPSDVVATIAC